MSIDDPGTPPSAPEPPEAPAPPAPPFDPNSVLDPDIQTHAIQK
ncbi:hypothetical protein BH11ACT3_BH11ACT3_17990 [soil metagenome]